MHDRLLKGIRGTIKYGVEKSNKHRSKLAKNRRDTPCVRCKKFFRESDVVESGNCVWCEWDIQQLTI